MNYLEPRGIYTTAILQKVGPTIAEADALVTPSVVDIPTFPASDHMPINPMTFGNNVIIHQEHMSNPYHSSTDRKSRHPRCNFLLSSVKWKINEYTNKYIDKRNTKRYQNILIYELRLHFHFPDRRDPAPF